MYGIGPNAPYLETVSVRDALTRAAKEMVAMVPQAGLTVEIVTTMFILKFGAWRHHMGAITKKRTFHPKEGAPPKKETKAIPAMFTLQAARAMVEN
jgi:hypothetical protein